MTTLQEAAKLAIEALEESKRHLTDTMRNAAIESLRTALAQHGEPVAWINSVYDIELNHKNWMDPDEWVPLYTAAPAPQPAQGVGRTNDPVTSKGKRKINKYEEEVLAQLSMIGPSTGKEIAALSQQPLNCITPHFATLRRKGLIKDIGVRRDKQIVWVLA